MLRITQFSDPHLTSDPAGLKGFDTFERFRRCVEHARQNQVATQDEIYILSGDIAHDESRETYQTLKDFMASTGVTWFCIPGNHDAPSLLHEVFPEHSPSVERGYMSFLHTSEVEVLLFSSHLSGEVAGELNETSLKRLSQSNGRAKLVALHHPPLTLNDPEFDAMALRNQERFWDCVENNADIVGVLFGHAHRAHRELRVIGAREVSVMCCPSTAFQYGGDTEAPYGFDPTQLGYRTLSYESELGLQSSVHWLEA